MTPNEVDAVNVGAALRDGLRLTAGEAVAIVHNVCEQLDAGIGVAPDRSIDELWVTDAGTVVSTSTTQREPHRQTVAQLLEELLPEDGNGSAAVPAALRSLPARIRESGNVTPAAELKDLLTALRWHLPADSHETLRGLNQRARETGTDSLPPAIGEWFKDEAPTADGAELRNRGGPLPIEWFHDEEPALVSEPVPVLLPLRTPKPQTTRRSWQMGSTAALIAILAMGAAGFAGYRFTLSRLEPAIAAAAVSEPAPLELRPGRVVPADVDAGAEVRTKPAIRADARPLDLPVSGGAFSPSFAPGGASLLFHAGHNSAGRLFQASLDKSGQPSAVTPLLEERGRTYHPRLSPDGAWVAFDSDRDGERGVYVASRNGQHSTRVSGDGFAAVPSWSPNMQWLAFVRAETSRPKVWNLWLRDVATGALARHSAFRSGQVWGASWFPDGRSLSYSHEDQLLISDLESGSTRHVASPMRGRLIRTPAVSPDGTRIVFQVYRDGAWLLDVGSGKMRRILADPTAEEFAWDPDGKQIAYHSRRDGQWRIWLLPL